MKYIKEINQQMILDIGLFCSQLVLIFIKNVSNIKLYRRFVNNA